MYLKIGTEEHIDAVVRMIDKFHHQNVYANLCKFSTKRTRESVKAVIDNPNAILIVLMNDEDIPVGCIIGLCMQPLFSDDLFATELVWWVDPEYRGKKDSLKLLDAYEYWAKEKMGSTVIQMVSLEEMNTDLLDRLYKRRNYKKTENVYIKEK